MCAEGYNDYFQVITHTVSFENCLCVCVLTIRKKMGTFGL